MWIGKKGLPFVVFRMVGDSTGCMRVKRESC